MQIRARRHHRDRRRGAARGQRRGPPGAALELATRYGDVDVEATGFVDASGDAALVWQAGFACREPANGRSSEPRWSFWRISTKPSQPTREEIGARMKEKGDAYGLVRREGLAFIIPGPRRRRDEHDARRDAARSVRSLDAPLEGKDQADRAVRSCARVSGLLRQGARARLRLSGHSQTRWIVGRQQLNGRRCARRHQVSRTRSRARPGRSNCTITAPDMSGRPSPRTTCITCRSGASLPPEADNVVAAGRCIDADNAALSSVRVMGPCIAMGAAAAHALDLAGTGSVHQIDLGGAASAGRDNVERTESGQAARGRPGRRTRADRTRGRCSTARMARAKARAMDLLLRYGRGPGRRAAGRDQQCGRRVQRLNAVGPGSWRPAASMPSIPN